MPKPSWGIYVVSEGLLIPDESYGQHEGMCTPIFPATHHPRGREAVRPTNDFPRKNCYHHSYPGYNIVAVSSISRKGASEIRLPEVGMDAIRRNVLKDSYEARERIPEEAKSYPRSSGEKIESAVDPSGEESLAPSSPPQVSSVPVSPRSTSHAISVDGNSGSEDPYENLSDVTSIASRIGPDASCMDGDEVFIRALETCIDLTCIKSTVKVWLDLNVLKSRKLHTAAEFQEERYQIAR